MSFTFDDPVLRAGSWSLIHAGANRPWSGQRDLKFAACALKSLNSSVEMWPRPADCAEIGQAADFTGLAKEHINRAAFHVPVRMRRATWRNQQ